MRKLHIVQGGIENGDKRWIENAARKGISARSWIVPKSVAIGDDVVIYIGGYGFYATGKITSLAKPREDWENRYGAGIESIKLITPPISLTTVSRNVPGLSWTKYPRSITTPDIEIADKIRELIRNRRRNGITEFNEQSLATMSLDELRSVAMMKAKPSLTPKERKILYRARSNAIRMYVLSRANGYCESCKIEAPFKKFDGTPYLEPHHVDRVADDGPDHPAKVIALCPNCHRRAHHANDAKKFNSKLKRLLLSLEI